MLVVPFLTADLKQHECSYRGDWCNDTDAASVTCVDYYCLGVQDVVHQGQLHFHQPVEIATQLERLHDFVHVRALHSPQADE
jgi:hypothetical protein